MRRIPLIALTIALLWGSTLPVSAASSTVEAQDNKFAPVTISAAAGDTLVFKNTGQAPHTATAKDGSFDTGNINPGESKTVTLSGAGAVKYVCKYHETIGMVGTVNIAAGGSAVAPATDPSPSPSDAGVGKQTAEKAAAPATPPPASEKYFPKIAMGMLVLLFILIGIGFLKTAMQNAKANR